MNVLWVVNVVVLLVHVEIGRSKYIRLKHSFLDSDFLDDDSNCKTADIGDKAVSPSIPARQWIDTPALVEETPGKYRVTGRKVFMDQVVDLMKAKGIKFDEKETIEEPTKKIFLEINADTVFMKNNIELNGLLSLKIYARKIVALDCIVKLSSTKFKPFPAAGESQDGKKGHNGIDGATVVIYAAQVIGKLTVESRASDGQLGQNGGSGKDGENGENAKPIPRDSCTDLEDCNKLEVNHAINVLRKKAGQGGDGGDGGNGGNSGNGGNAGVIEYHVNITNGLVQLKTCAGKSGPGGQPGAAGKGGARGEGTQGIMCVKRCSRPSIFSAMTCGCIFFKASQFKSGNGNKGKDGEAGTSGQAGRDGSSPTDVMKNQDFTKFPIKSLSLILKVAEDMLGRGMGEEASKIIGFLKLASFGNDPGKKQFMKDVIVKFAFTDSGFDVFGNPPGYAPSQTWTVYNKRMEQIKDSAVAYENSYNELQQMIEDQKSVEEIASHVTSTTQKTVEAEIRRLTDFIKGMQAEKTFYVKGVREIESRLEKTLGKINTVLPRLLGKATVTKGEVLGILQGLVGFIGGVASGNVAGAVGSFLGIAGQQARRCKVESFTRSLQYLKKGLDFGQAFQEMDPEDLDFTKLDISAIPEILKSDLETNKNELITALFCILNKAPHIKETHELTNLIDQFFTDGGLRAQLIGKLLSLTDKIQDNNFALKVMKESDESIRETKVQGVTVTKEMQELFLDDLLGPYKTIERSFRQNIYLLMKATEFKTLWSYDRSIGFTTQNSEAAKGNGRLIAVQELVGTMEKVRSYHQKAEDCFSKFRSSNLILSWTYDKEENTEEFARFHETGKLIFTVNLKPIEASKCYNCHNARMVKYHVELMGEQEQPDLVDTLVDIRLTHSGYSGFRAEGDNIKVFRQSQGQAWAARYDRLVKTDVLKCRDARRQGKDSSACLNSVTDRRWNAACSHSLNNNLGGGSLSNSECKSPYSTYILEVPKSKYVRCDGSDHASTNCGDLKWDRITKIKFWAVLQYWPDKYPSGPTSSLCKGMGKRGLRMNNLH